MFPKIKTFLAAHKYTLSLVATFFMSVIISMILGSLLQYHWRLWNPRTMYASRFIVYPIFIILIVTLRCFTKYKNQLVYSPITTLRPLKEKLFFPYRPGKVPKSDGKAFAKLFAYGTAISRGEEHLAHFILKFGLTNKEADVMRLLICSDATIKELSHDLMVSERVCQRHLTNIYEKTGTKSRLSLLMKFYE